MLLPGDGNYKAKLKNINHKHAGNEKLMTAVSRKSSREKATLDA